MNRRGCIHRDGRTDTNDRRHHATGEDARPQWQDPWQLHFLGQLLPGRSAISSLIVFLRLAGQVWQC